MEKRNENNKLYTFSTEDNNSESQTETSQCQNIEHFYVEKVKSGAPEVDVLIDLALLQYHCTKKLIENQNEESFYIEQQVILQKKVMTLIGKVKPRLFEIDEYSATAIILFLNDFNRMILDNQSTFKVDLAQSLSYYLKHLLRDEGSKVRAKRSIESYKDEDIVNPFSKEYVDGRIDYAHLYQLLQEVEKALAGINEARSIEEKRTFVSNFLRFAGELLENKVTVADTEGLNSRVVKALSDLIGPVDSFISFRDLETHGKFSRDVNLSEELVNRFADEVLRRVKDASLVIMSNIETKHIAEIFYKCSNEKLKSFLEEKGLSKAKLKELGVAGIKEAINDIRREKEFSPLKKEGEKIFTEVESSLKEMKTGELKNFNPEKTDKSLRKDKRSIEESTKKLSDFVKNENKQTVKYLTDKIMEGEEIKKLSKEVATQKLKEFIDYLHPGKLKDNVSELVKKGNYKEVITILSKDTRYKEDVKRIISGTEFREAIKKIAERMVASGIKGDSIIRNYLERVLSEKELTKGVDVVKGEYLQILIERKNSYIEEIKILNRESIPDDVLLSLHDLLTKIDDLQGIYESIDWKSDKGSLERVKEVVERIKEFGKEASYRLETGFRNEFDGVKPNKLIGIYESEVNKYKKRGEALGTDLREKIDKMNKIVERTINSVETKLFDKARNSISHIDITQEGEMSDKLKVQKEQALEVFKEVIKREGANTSRLSFEKEIISIQNSGVKGDSKKKYESFSRLIEGFDICAGSSQSRSKSAPGRRILLAMIEKPMLQFSLGKGCFEIEEVEKFAEVDNEYRITSIDSEKIISSIKEAQNKGDIESVHRLVDLTKKYEVSGKSRLAITQLGEVHEQYSDLERLGRISGHINQGLMAKDFIDELVAGDYKDAAINAAFFASSHGLSMVSNLASMKGVTYISEGKVLLGKSLKLSAPFVSRMTSALVAYDLYNQVQEYKKGNKDAIMPIIGDSIQLSADTLSIGVEVGELAGFEGISAVLGPVGEAIGLLVFMGGQIYSAVKTVEKIDEKIHLTGMERFDEGFRAFMGIGIEKGLDIAIEEKNLNNQVVKGIVDFLRNNSHVKRAIFPSMSVDHIKMYSSEVVADVLYWGLRFSSPVLAAGLLSPKFNWYNTCYPEEKIVKPYSDNEVFLDKKLNKNELRWIRGAPGEPDKGKIYFAVNDKINDESGFKWLKGDENEITEGKLFCIPSAEEGVISSTEKTYKSKNAIGVKYGKDRKGKATFINLTEGKNTIIGFSNKPNIFAIGQGYKNIIGGESDDLFKFVEKSVHNQSPYITGVMDGRGGTDTLDIAALSSEIKNIVINFQEKKLLDTENKLSLEVKNINNFIGRVGKIDTVNAACDTRHIDARGGVNDSNYDAVTINDDICNYDAKVIIRPYTKVDSKAKAGVIRYIVNEKEVGTASVNIDANSKCDHQFIFVNYKLDDISSIKIQESTVSFSFSVSNSKFKLLVNGSPIKYSYQLSDSTKLIIGQKNLYALHNTQEPINRSSIERYSNIAKKLKMNLVVHSNEEVLSVGHDHHDVIQNDPTAKVSHLVGNGGENIFILKSGVGIKNLPLAGVVLYNFNRKEATRDTLDLREINKQVKELLEDELTFAVNETGKDLKVTLFTQSSKQIIEIRLKDALENHWYKMLDVLINGVLIIEKTDNSFKLSPKPLIFSDRYKTTYVITPNDVERENSIEIKKSIGNYVFARDDNTLVITNALQSSTDEPSTVLLSNFYINDKMKTLNIKFGDKEVVLAKELNRIMELNNKNDFHDRVEQFRTNGYRSAMDYKPLNRRLQHDSNKDALNLQVKLDYSLQQVRYNNDEPMSKEELIVENLFSAMRNNDRKWLVDHESDLSVTGKGGEALLHIAALKGYLEVVKYLVSKHVDIYAKDNNGMTIMHYAALGGSIDVIKYLINKDIEIDTKSKEGRTPLHSAASAGHLPAMEYLINQGADLNATNRDQVTTLHYAVEGNNEEVIEYLLKKGFDINASTHRGKTPIHYAAKKGSLEVIKYLVKHGANVTTKASFG
ncbi:MAG: ankyrin repeat domain-containing protein, partial [Wolbachia endosymbiont of Fragariocoptes setiger]|nr:ankyrin repeat domain-containing protein [Wolbachia endosymbiont of Fragariocoptes setiger]